MLLLILLSQIAMADTWFCSNESGQRTGNTVYACGIGESLNDEALSRKRALQNAIDEFKMICELSKDCQGREITIEPKRTECKITSLGLLKCYRLIQINIE